MSNNTRIEVSGSDGKNHVFEHDSSTSKVWETTQPWLGMNAPTVAGSAKTVAGAIDVAKSASANTDGQVHLS